MLQPSGSNPVGGTTLDLQVLSRLQVLYRLVERAVERTSLWSQPCPLFADAREGTTLALTGSVLIRTGVVQHRLIAQLRRQAAIDPLIGLVTRRVLDAATQSAVSGAETQVGTSLVMIDVDRAAATTSPCDERKSSSASSATPRSCCRAGRPSRCPSAPAPPTPPSMAPAREPPTPAPTPPATSPSTVGAAGSAGSPRPNRGHPRPWTPHHPAPRCSSDPEPLAPPAQAGMDTDAPRRRGRSTPRGLQILGRCGAAAPSASD